LTSIYNVINPIIDKLVIDKYHPIAVKYSYEGNLAFLDATKKYGFDAL
jgi:hypothetical protein